WQTTLFQEGIAATNETNAYDGMTLPEMQSIISIAGIVTGLFVAPAIVYMAGRWRDGLLPFCFSSSRSSLLSAAILSALSIPCAFLYVWATGHQVYLAITGSILAAICNAALIPLTLETILSIDSSHCFIFAHDSERGRIFKLDRKLSRCLYSESDDIVITVIRVHQLIGDTQKSGQTSCRSH
ncbi:hypothetical protein PFISCL1PPCAC_2551, partial [Pristionchus fissidentatus]